MCEGGLAHKVATPGARPAPQLEPATFLGAQRWRQGGEAHCPGRQHGLSDEGAEAEGDTEDDGHGVVGPRGPATRRSPCQGLWPQSPRTTLRAQPPQKRTSPGWLETRRPQVARKPEARYMASHRWLFLCVRQVLLDQQTAVFVSVVCACHLSSYCGPLYAFLICRCVCVGVWGGRKACGGGNEMPLPDK